METFGTGTLSVSSMLDTPWAVLIWLDQIGNGLKLCQGGFRLGIRIKFFPDQAVE